MSNFETSHEPQPGQIFRRRVFILLLLILLILLLGRICSAQLAPAAPVTPTPTLQSNPLTPTGTITPFPESLFTPVVTFSAIPPTFFQKTHTVIPTSLPENTYTPTPTTTQTPPSATPGDQVGCSGFGELRGRQWIVAGCDTLERISQVTGISLGQLLAANPEIKDPDLIYPGQRIQLPAR